MLMEQRRSSTSNQMPSLCTLHTEAEAELDRLEKAGIMQPVQFSDWAAPTVPESIGDS